jgi:Ca2+-binding RTX toxin-like protein
VSAAAFSCLAATASASTATSATMFGNGDFIGGRSQLVFDASNATIQVGGTASRLETEISSRNESYSIEVSAPAGQTLRPGVYTGATFPFGGASPRPAVAVYGAGRGCSRYTGSFEIKDIEMGPTGAPARLWLLYESHCEGGQAATFGEVRYQAPEPGAGLVTSPGALRWPGTDVGGADVDLPVKVAAAFRTVHVGGVTVTGPAAGDFVVRNDGCSNHDVPAGGSCALTVGFVPTAAGPRSATLHVPDAAGGTRDIPLEGVGHAGATSATVDGDAADPTVRGGSGSYSTADSRFGVSGAPWYANAGVARADGHNFSVSLSPPQGQQLAPGHYDENTGSHFSVNSSDHCAEPGAGTFDISTITFDGDGHPSSLDVSFAQSCHGYQPTTVRGRFAWRAGDPALGIAVPWAAAGGRPAAWAVPMCAAAPRALRRGTSRNNRITGHAAATKVVAGAGNDRVTTLAGDDCLYGGKGRDVLRAGPGEDYVEGGPGRDVIDCGDGFDVAKVTPGDRVTGCERVVS